MSRPAVFLDRDGTINHDTGYLSLASQFELLPNAAAAIRAINLADYHVIVVTNQSAVARGKCTLAQLQHVHEEMTRQLGKLGAFLDDIRFCPHHPDRNIDGIDEFLVDCDCRKPKPGMIIDAARQIHVDLRRSWLVGDTTVDIMTAKNAGIRSILVGTGYGGSDARYDVKPDHTCPQLRDAVAIILGQDKRI